MTIPALIVINLLVGASVAFSARIQIRTLQRPVFTTRYFSALMILEAMILLPVGIYFYAFYPDWSWMYMVDSTQVLAPVEIMAMAAYPISGAMGYLVGYYSAKGGSDWVTILFMCFMGLGLFGLFIAAYDKVSLLGTYDQFHRDVGLKGFASTSMLSSTLLAGAGVGTCWFYLLLRFFQEGRLSLRAF